jgi:hypothetical protein
MSGDMFIVFAGCVVLAWALVLAHLWLVTLREESRRWRRLIQLYLEKQVHAVLPVDTDENESMVSALHLPAEDLEELEREDEEEAAAQAARLI